MAPADTPSLRQRELTTTGSPTPALFWKLILLIDAPSTEAVDAYTIPALAAGRVPALLNVTLLTKIFSAALAVPPPPAGVKKTRSLLIFV